MNILNKGPILLALIIISVACGELHESKEQEIEFRQDSAFDVSGNYYEQINQGSPSTLLLTNERGFYDVSGRFTLKRQFDIDELLTLEGALRDIIPGITDTQIFKAVRTLEKSLNSVRLGEGNTMNDRGGESVPLEPARNTSELVMSSPFATFKTIETESGKFNLRRKVTTYFSSERNSNELGFSLTAHTDRASRAIDGQKGVYLYLSAAEGRSAKNTGPMRLNINPLTKF